MSSSRIKSSSNQKEVLVIGYGHMGRIHGKSLTNLKVNWTYYDPFVDGGHDSLDNISKFTHLIIAAPTNLHYKIYQKVKDHPGDKLIEKPAVLDRSQFDVFDDPKVIVGMVERFNPTVIALRCNLEPTKITRIDCFRTRTPSARKKDSIIESIGIHDIDLFLKLLCIETPPKITKSYQGKTESFAVLDYYGVPGYLNWKLTTNQERRIIVYQNDIQYVADLIDQTVTRIAAGKSENLPVSPAKPVELELAAFLAGDKFSSKLTHDLLLQLLHQEDH